MRRKSFLSILILLSLSINLFADELPVITEVEAQPLRAQVLRLVEALDYLGSALQEEDKKQLLALQELEPDGKMVQTIQNILDPYCLAMVTINPESRVKIMQGDAPAELMQDGWSSFLIKVNNQAGITAILNVESPNALPLFHGSTGSPRVQERNILTEGDVAERFLELDLFRRPPLKKNLSGLALEYVVLQVYTTQKGQREAQIGFNVGQGTQEIGFLNSIPVLFTIKPSVRVVLNVLDDDGSPTMASFIITDQKERVVDDPKEVFPADYRLERAQRRMWEDRSSDVKRLAGIYPLPSRRLALHDEYPDFFFHPQVYRADGEHVYLPPGKYQIEYSRGPEYLTQTKEVVIPAEGQTHTLTFQLKRWIHMAAQGWYSADHHVHAAGCSHYESPSEGVLPQDMWRQALGEDLNIACVLTWGPCWYYQKNFFKGEDHELSQGNYIMRYDVEVSGFPSSHAGHVCLLRLKEDDYPGSTKIEDWPSWTLPVLKWAKSQGGATGYAHSGWGLQPVDNTTRLPNYALPKMDGIGANEYVVTVTHNAVDFYSTVDTPYPWELNMWYHTLNCGFRTRISGETDFPCIFDDRVGLGRVYAKLEELSFNRMVDQIIKGRSYVSDGKSHIIDFTVNDVELGTQNSELHLEQPQEVVVKARVAALLPEEQDEIGKIIASLPPDRKPYWDIERARIEDSRRVPVELVVNGYPVAKQEIIADGEMNEVSFPIPVEQSSWIALRILPSSHTNPIFVQVDGKPIYPSRRSAEWCRAAVDQCWKMKLDGIREEERAEAKAAYDHARKVYEEIIRNSADDTL